MSPALASTAPYWRFLAPTATHGRDGTWGEVPSAGSGRLRRVPGLGQLCGDVFKAWIIATTIVVARKIPSKTDVLSIATPTSASWWFRACPVVPVELDGDDALRAGRDAHPAGVDEATEAVREGDWRDAELPGEVVDGADQNLVVGDDLEDLRLNVG